MSNFMFPVCKNINCGNKKEREIEIEKKLPEIGDVWKLANDIYYVVLYYNKYSVIALRSDELSIYRLLPCQLGEYVGKSKVNINDLFEVKSD